MTRNNSPIRQSGVALIVVLMIFAIAATLASAILYRQSHFQERTGNLLNWDLRYQYALSVEAIAVQGLQMDLEQDMTENQLLDSCAFEQWAVALPPTPYAEAIVTASVQDLQARFNLNWVVKGNGDSFIQDPEGIKALQRLLSNLLSDPASADKLAYELADWADSNSQVDAIDGAEDESYELYRTPNLPIADESEFSALLGMAPELIANPDFWQYVTALPLPSKLNVNNAPPMVLDAVLGEVAGTGAAEAIVNLRASHPIASLDEIMEIEPFSELPNDQAKAIRERLSVNSHYFQVMTDAKVAGQFTRLASRLVRPEQGETQVYSRELLPRLGPLESACNPVYNADNSNTQTTNPIQ